MKGWAINVGVMAAAVAAFVFLAALQIELPGLYHDEAADAVPAMQLVLGERSEPGRGTALWLGERALPLMTMNYVGAVNSYLLAPFFAVLGVGVAPLRLAMIVVAAVAIVFTFLLTRELLGAAAARAATLLLATHPSFVFFSRQGVHVTSVMAPLLLAGLWCLVRWSFPHGKDGHKDRYLYIGCFLFGVGVWAKVLFVWFVVAAGAVYVGLRLSRRPLPRLGAARAVGAAIVFAIGALPLVVYNVLHIREGTAGTLAAVASHARISQYGIDNLAIVANLGQRLDNLHQLLDGGFFWFLGGPFALDFYPYLVGGGIVFGGVVAAIVLLSKTRLGERSGPAELRRQAAGFVVLLAFVGLVVAQSGATISGLWPTHFYALLPLLMALFGGGLALLARAILGRWTVLRLVALTVVVGGLVAASVAIDLRYHEALARSRGLANHSDAIYALARYLDAPVNYRVAPLALDWGIQASVQLLTQGRVAPVEAYGYSPQPDAAFADRLYGYILPEGKDAERRYLFHDYGFTVFDRRDAFAALARQLGREPRVEAVFTQADGRPVFVVETALVPTPESDDDER